MKYFIAFWPQLAVGIDSCTQEYSFRNDIIVWENIFNLILKNSPQFCEPILKMSLSIEFCEKCTTEINKSFILKP